MSADADTPDWDTLFPGVPIPQAKPAPPQVADHLEVRLQSHPALGKVTVLQGGCDVSLLVVLEIPQFRADEPWEVQLRYASDDEDWAYLPLSRAQRGKEPQTIHARPQHLARFYFDTDAEFPSCASFRFTFIFRGGEAEAWRCIGDEQGLGDGRVIIASTSPSSTDGHIQSIIPDLGPAWSISSHVEQTSCVQTWVLNATIPEADGDTPAFGDFEIGTAWGSFLR